MWLCVEYDKSHRILRMPRVVVQSRVKTLHCDREQSRYCQGILKHASWSICLFCCIF